jgi:hypothetical protein
LATLPACEAPLGASPSDGLDGGSNTGTEGSGRTGQTSQAVVRGQATSAYPGVVLVHAERWNGLVTVCSGSVIAPRVVLTAAHCIPEDAIRERVFVYYGTDYAADTQTYIEPPPPSAPSVWARAETFAQHPDWSRERFHPDLALVHLDRRLPMKPIPLARTPLGEPFVGRAAKLVGWGADGAATADLSEVSELGTKRQGTVTLLGSPTLADRVPTDPHPGLEFPEVQRGLLKTSGEAPSANGCAGDSGAPLLVRMAGEERIGGVLSWVGEYCEDYSLFTRTEPFLRYLEQGIRQGGQLPVTPEFDCISTEPDGTQRAWFGYENQNLVTVELPLDGLKNWFPQDRKRARPKLFGPGEHRYAFYVPHRRGAWYWYSLAYPGGSFATLLVGPGARACEDTGSGELALARACATLTAFGCGETQDACMSRTRGELTWLEENGLNCAAPYYDLVSCLGRLTPAELQCLDTQAVPVYPSCADETDAYFACWGF